MVLTYLNILRMPTAILPFVLVCLFQAKASLDRINKFMNSEELDKGAIGHDDSIKDQIQIQNGHFKWAKDEPIILENINFCIKVPFDNDVTNAEQLYGDTVPCLPLHQLAFCYIIIG